MLVQFRFKNFGPFRDEAVFDMRAVRAYKEHQDSLIIEDEKNGYLKVAAIYGANASGKTNFVDAYWFFTQLVRWSFSKNDKDRTTPFLESCYRPFIFDESFRDDDTEFEGVFHHGNIEYKYGFSYNRNQINYEWLYKKSIETNRSSKILERSPDKITLGSSVRSCEKYLGDIDSDVLALSFFSSLKLRTHVFKDVLDCISSFLAIRPSVSKNMEALLDSYFEFGFDNEEKIQLLGFLSAIDVGIKDIEVSKNEGKIAVYTFHSNSKGTLDRVPLEIESDGTIKAMSIYSLIRTAVFKDLGIIIDELNMQLHPLLVKYLVDLFTLSSKTAQLIYTTHDTTMLNKRYMRRDQIWFTEKDDTGASSLYSLADYKIRNDESFDKMYLSGVFGAIPELDTFSFAED